MKPAVLNSCAYGILLIVCSLCVIGVKIEAQSPVGVWKQISHKKDTVTSHVKIYEKDGKLFGKVLRLTPAAEVRVCDRCDGDRAGEPVEGMQILWDMEPEEGQWVNGKILAPKTGREYHCIIKMKDEDTLEVRGHLGIPVLGKSQEWIRLE